MQAGEHEIVVNNREWVSITGVKHVDSYDDKQIVLKTEMGNLLLKGEELNIKGLNLDEGKLEVVGLIESFRYTEEQGARTRKLLNRLLK